MAMTRYEPWSLLNQLQRELSDIGDGPGQRAGETGVVTGDWVPAVDVREDKDAYTLHADLPGVDPKDIEITMENGVLTIKGERRWENAEEREGFKRTERARGTFYRRFSLPDSVDADKISANCNQGVLEVKIPKHEKVQPRRIQVEG